MQFHSKVRSSDMGAHSLCRCKHNSGLTALAVLPVVHKYVCRTSASVFVWSGTRSFSTLCGDSNFIQQCAEYPIHGHCSTDMSVMSNMYYTLIAMIILVSMKARWALYAQNPFRVCASTTISPIRLRLLEEVVAHLVQGCAPRPSSISEAEDNHTGKTELRNGKLGFARRMRSKKTCTMQCN